MKAVLAALCAAGCGVESVATVEQPALSADVKHGRLALIRDAAAEMGLHNAALLGGIAVSETNLAHCWSEATYACKGPATPSCDGGPIIAGSADGPCADEQGGLGMFQFDAGTYAQTVATYTDAILTVEGNTAQAVAFVVDKVIQDIDGVTDWMSAVAWMDAVPMTAGDPVTEQWAKLLACRYNGCCSTSSLCTSRANGYRDNAIDVFTAEGADFWRTADRCAGVPDGGIIDQRTACYVAGGEPRYWARETGGYGDNRETTHTTAAKAPSNFARWLLRPARAGTYHLEVHVTGATATNATYTIVHAGTTDTVAIDQSMADGFVALGDFDFAADGSEYVELGDNTGTKDQTLVFDALSITPPGVPPGGDTGGGDEGGCRTSHGVAWPAAGLLAVLFARRRRRR